MGREWDIGEVVGEDERKSEKTTRLRAAPQKHVVRGKNNSQKRGEMGRGRRRRGGVRFGLFRKDGSFGIGGQLIVRERGRGEGGGKGINTW